MDHDRIFKELLTVFFAEFVALFLPDVAAYLDTSTLEFLDKEVFTDVTAGKKHQVDLVVKARFRGQDTFFLVHVENQSKLEADFPKRMFNYFARLHEKYDLPVYPVVLFSHNAPKGPEPQQYTVTFPDKNVLDFQYTVIQLNRLPWREFVHQANPVASALMAKMKMSPKERPKVKLECLRLLATLKLDPARSKLIGGFIETYLQLNAEEMTQYEEEFAKLTLSEKEATMELMTSWERKGREEGIHAGKESIVMRQLQSRFGKLSGSLEQQIDQLSAAQMDDLSIALLNFSMPSDLEAWLQRQNQQ